MAQKPLCQCLYSACYFIYCGSVQLYLSDVAHQSKAVNCHNVLHPAPAINGGCIPSIWCCRLDEAFGKVLLKLLAKEENCHVLLAGGHAVSLVQRLASLLDQCIAREGADKGLGKDSAALDTLLQVG